MKFIAAIKIHEGRPTDNKFYDWQFSQSGYPQGLSTNKPCRLFFKSGFRQQSIP
ncbi:hypothetical protein GL2_16040 [Microbulbifer sp. GL-2]|nr:hypothetical protein GL2_16040 [Microbulbifer sp. GL-2]